MREEDTETPTKQGKLSRRDMLKLGGLGVGVAALAASNKNRLFSHEKLLGSSMLVLDLFNLPDHKNDVDQLKLPATDEEIRTVAYDYYKKTHGSHGEMVKDVMQKALVELGDDSSGNNDEYVSIYPALRINSFEKDNLGNVSAIVEISEDEITKLVGQSSASFVNMSFEVGKTRIHAEFVREEEVLIEGETREDDPSETKITADVNGIRTESYIYTDSHGNSITEEQYNILKNKGVIKQKVVLAPQDRVITHEDGYSGEFTYDNLLKLTNIASKFPDKIFFAAGGNPDPTTGKRPDIREARQQLQDQGLWVDNLIMVGFTDINLESDNVEPMQFGDDYYVDSQSELNLLGHEGSSSAATAFLSTFARRISKGTPTKTTDVDDKLDKFTKVESVFIGEPLYDTIEYKKLDYGKG